MRSRPQAARKPGDRRDSITIRNGARGSIARQPLHRRTSVESGSETDSNEPDVASRSLNRSACRTTDVGADRAARKDLRDSRRWTRRCGPARGERPSRTGAGRSRPTNREAIRNSPPSRSDRPPTRTRRPRSRRGAVRRDRCRDMRARRSRRWSRTSEPNGSHELGHVRRDREPLNRAKDLQRRRARIATHRRPIRNTNQQDERPNRRDDGGHSNRRPRAKAPSPPPASPSRLGTSFVRPPSDVRTNSIALTGRIARLDSLGESYRRVAAESMAVFRECWGRPRGETLGRAAEHDTEPPPAQRDRHRPRRTAARRGQDGGGVFRKIDPSCYSDLDIPIRNPEDRPRAASHHTPLADRAEPVFSRLISLTERLDRRGPGE